MSESAIRVSHAYKKFQRGERHGSLRDAIGSWLRLNQNGGKERDLRDTEFWALEDLNLEVVRGEAFGVIGPNGAGKSTLLKLLAGIMRPNSGTVSIDGRVSALIEVGAGFHPDLTGRENIDLNASIMGMSRREVCRKFDDIVDFAGIRDFLDTPIKRYSSGMHARLGFSVAAHVEPQVLLVDEVLSVGDRPFRAKCMERMRSFLDKGAAVVFVSHDLRAVAGFCDRALVLSAGKTIFSGSANDAVAHYHEACSDKWMLPEAETRSLVELECTRLLKADGTSARTFAPGERMQIEFDVRFNMNMPKPSFGLALTRADDQLVVFETSSTRMHCHCSPARVGSLRRVRYQIQLNVPPGEYSVGYHVRDRDASMYADLRMEEVRLTVLGESISGGMVDLAPRVEVTDILADAPIPATASA